MKNLMYVKESVNQNGSISLILRCSGKDPLTKKYKVYVKTFHVPFGMRTRKDISNFSLQCQLEWKSEVEKISNGLSPMYKNKIIFYDYAKKWVEDIIRYNKESYKHYTRCKSNLKFIKEKFGNLTLDEITLPVIQNFCDWLCERTYDKVVVTVKSDISHIIKDKNLKYQDICNLAGVSDTSLSCCRTIGSHISLDTAKRVCSTLGIPIDKYFNVVHNQVPYSKNSNKALKNLVHIVLKKAVIEGLIDKNYATSEYTKKITGPVKNKEIFGTKEEIKEFIKLAMSEPDIRKKTAFLTILCLGIRGAELTGLSWKNFNFNNNTVHIEKNTMYISGYGIKTKGTKNKSSNRTIQIPEQLIPILFEYKQWWDEQKEMHGDLWENTDKLFVQENGNDMANDTINKWLKKFESQHNLKNVTLHGLRHTNITMLITSGIDVKTVAARVGHSDVQTTLDIYSHYTQESDANATNIVNNMLKLSCC